MRSPDNSALASRHQSNMTSIFLIKNCHTKDGDKTNAKIKGSDFQSFTVSTGTTSSGEPILRYDGPVRD